MWPLTKVESFITPKTIMKINLSPWSLGMLRTDNAKFYKKIVMKDYSDDEYILPLKIGIAGHAAAEDWNLHGDWKQSEHEKAMVDDMKANGVSAEDIAKSKVEYQNFVNNLKGYQNWREKRAEETLLLPLDDVFTVKCKVDAVADNYLLDYKSVSGFTNLEGS